MANSLVLGLRVSAAVLLMGLMGVLWRRHRVSVHGRFAIGLCAGLLSYLAAQNWARSQSMGWLWVLGAAANPALVWLFARSLFSDGVASQGVNRKHMIIACALTILIQFFSLKSFFTLGLLPELAVVFDRLLPQLLSVGLVGLAVIEAQREARADLLEPRLQLRRVLVTLIAGYGLLTLIFEVALGDMPPPYELELAHQGALTALAACAFGFVWRHGGVLFGEPHRSGPSPTLLAEASRHVLSMPPAQAQPGQVNRSSSYASHPDEVLRTRLADWENGKGFLQSGLTIRALATQLGTQEYLLRRFLNGTLGFRNFNDFVHQLRIAEACRRLVADDGADLSILKLSIELGYSSLATFNRAFKSIVGKTPTEYRNDCRFRS